LLLKTRHQERWEAQPPTLAHACGHEEEDDDDTAEFDPEWTLTEQDIRNAPTNEAEPGSTEDYFVEFQRDSETPTTSETTRHNATDPTIFLAGIIKILWAEMGILWRSHLEYNHKTAETKNSPVTLQDNQTQVRALHNLKEQVQESHRSSYFHDDIDTFLEKSTGQQLGHYIAMYQPVIMASISRRHRPAHQRQHSAAAVPPDGDPNIPPPRQRTTTTIDRDENNRLLIHPALEEAPHRKRTRIRSPVEPRIPNRTTMTDCPSSSDSHEITSS
jgi:hypothetical protein